MPAWITVTLADLNDARVAELIDALRKEELGAGQTDPMPRRIQTVIDEVRRFTAKCASTPLDIDTTKIPPSTKDNAVEEIVRRLKKRLLISLTDDEVRDDKKYQAMLEDLRDGKWPVDATDTPATTPTVTTTGSSQIISNGRCLSSSDLGGL